MSEQSQTTDQGRSRLEPNTPGICAGEGKPQGPARMQRGCNPQPVGARHL
jgi:hypothetical protein